MFKKLTITSFICDVRRAIDKPKKLWKNKYEDFWWTITRSIRGLSAIENQLQTVYPNLNNINYTLSDHRTATTEVEVTREGMGY